MYTLKASLRDGMFLTGLFFIAVSILTFYFPVILHAADSTLFTSFLISFALTVAYFFAGLVRRHRTHKNRALLLVLFLISAYSLNRLMEVFEVASTWFFILQVIVCINFILFAFFEFMPAWLKHLQCFIMGIAMMVFIYLAIYLLPLYAPSLAASLVFGFSLHTFVPLLFCLLTIAMMRSVARPQRKYWISFAAGAMASLTITAVFIVYWCHYVKQINTTFTRASVKDNNDLPAWVSAAQQLPLNVITERVLESDIVYAIPDLDNGMMLWRMPTRNFRAREHDPLVMSAALFSGKVTVPIDDRIRMLQCLYNARHEAQERFWAGDDLVTCEVKGDVLLWPQQRISYTQLDLTVGHTESENRWRNQQEAIYTFYLPEGGVVSSLSLWINGKEEKGILTTKEKADSAYRTIVGREMRDPSVVHWQEGNAVTVRVFPVISGESRRFRIGVSAPMTLSGKELVYEQLRFDGPPAAAAAQQITVHIDGKKYERKGRYQAGWKYTVPAPAIQPGSFSFDGSAYSVHPARKQHVPFTPTAIYLDINASWTRAELQAVYELVRERPVLVAGNRRLTALDLDRIYEEMSAHTFNLFPFDEIGDNPGALVISKSSLVSPSIDDIKESPFMKRLQGYFTQGRQVKVFDIGSDLSPYLRSLKEFRALQYMQGDLFLLRQTLSSRTFAVNREDANSVVIDNAAISIERTAATAPAAGPDHIMRLFAYNHILQQSGAGLLEGAVITPDLVKEAEKAHIVTPVSSLVVLETQEDYQRFGIKNSENSLRNASANSTGAVPEPHEWALIILVCITIFFFKYRPAWIKR